MTKKKEQIEYTPTLTPKDVIRVNPAIDFKDKAYFGIYLPVKEDVRDKFFLITSYREIISPYKKNSEIFLTHNPVYYNRWNLDSINEFKKSMNSLPIKDLFYEIVEILKSYIEFPQEEIYDFIALWIMGTYLFPLFKTYPYVYIGGVKQTGKSKTLHITSLMSFNSIFSTSISTSALFRLIESGRCSLFMDESEKLSNPKRSADFREILLSGYKRSGKSHRSEKTKDGQFYVKDFEVYSPKMLANIYGLENILEDRCIKFIMKRTLSKEIGDKEIDDESFYWPEIRGKLYVFAMDYWEEIKKIYDVLGNQTGLSNRDWELWHPIFAIASLIEKELYDRMVELAKQKSIEKHTENITETGEYLLIQALLGLVEDKTGFIPVKSIQDKMQLYFDGEQKWLNTKWIGRALGRLGFKDKRRIGTGIEYQLSVNSVNDIANRLGISLQNTTTQTSQTSQTTLKSEVNEVNEVSEVKKNDNKKEMNDK